MAKYKVAGNTQVKVDNTAGSLVAMTSYIDTISSLGKEIAELDATTFADLGERIIAGLETGQEVTMSGPFDDTATTGPDAVLSQLIGTIGTIEYHPVGTASGDRKISREFLCTRYVVDSSVKERVNYEAVFKLDGTIVIGTN